MEDPVISEFEAAKHLMGLATAELTGRAPKVQVGIGPFSAFTIISCLQYAQRKPGQPGIFTGVTGQLIEQLSQMFDPGGTTRKIIAQGSDPRQDITEAEATQRIDDALGQLMNDPGMIAMAAQLAEPHTHPEPEDGEHIYRAPHVTEMEAMLAVANILGLEPKELVGFIVLGFNGSTPILMSNGDKDGVIWALERALVSLHGKAEGEPIPHANDSGVYAGQVGYTGKDGQEHMLGCPLCKCEQWLAGTLADGDQVITCGKCKVTLNTARVNELLRELGAQQVTGGPDEQS